MYAQAQATIAICELYGMTKDSWLRPRAELAIKFAEKSQSPEGGWRYEPNFDSDTSVTGWFVMALESGRAGGLEVNISPKSRTVQDGRASGFWVRALAANCQPKLAVNYRLSWVDAVYGSPARSRCLPEGRQTYWMPHRFWDSSVWINKSPGWHSK